MPLVVNWRWLTGSRLPFRLNVKRLGDKTIVNILLEPVIELTNSTRLRIGLHRLFGKHRYLFVSVWPTHSGSLVERARWISKACHSLPWRQPFLSVIECMCDLPMYWMHILSYIVLSQKWLNKDDETKTFITGLLATISHICLGIEALNGNFLTMHVNNDAKVASIYQFTLSLTMETFLI